MQCFFSFGGMSCYIYVSDDFYIEMFKTNLFDC